MAAIRRPWTVWLLRYPAEPDRVRRSSRQTRAAPPISRQTPEITHRGSSFPIKPIQVPSRLGSIGRAGFSRRALELVRSGN